jgi:hypothetical protein
MLTKQDIDAVYTELKTRAKNPRGRFDSAGRFYVDDEDLLSVRTPSRAWPYAQMTAARTRKFVTALATKYACKTLQDLQKVAFA